MVTTGVLGGRWRATVTPWGGLEPWLVGGGHDEPALQWYIAADDRWHTPEREAAVRQTRLEGTSVVETRVRIPSGDAVQRVYSVPDAGGLTIIEVENESPLPIAVAFSHGRLLSPRPPTAPIEGIELPAGSVAFPVGHHSTLTVALAHDGSGPGVLPNGLPPVAGVVRGWLAMVERASRLVLPDSALAELVVSERCELALAGPEHPDDDPVGFLLGVAQLVRMGEQADPWLPDVAAALEAAYKVAPHDWALAAAFDAVDSVLVAASDSRARKDLAAMRATVALPSHLPADAPTETARLVAWHERRLVLPSAGATALLPAGLPPTWAGDNFEVYGLPNGVGGTVSFALRWHGARPAVLWEQTGSLATLTSPALAPDWSAGDAKGETLWPEPAGLPHAPIDIDPEGGSFS
jgi:hypothetical protein